MKKFLLKNGIWILLLVCVFTRFPQLQSPYLLMDGDECIVGLMAKHLYEGKEFPLYFYGQAYGFSLIELLYITVFYFFFGVSALSVKLAMLCLWSTGLIFFYKTLKLLCAEDSFLPLLIAILLTLVPAWALWSMMARGGYLTAFTFSTVFLYLLLHPAKFKSNFSWLLSGVLLLVIYESQALWLPGLLPVIVFVLYKQKEKRGILFLITGVLFAVPAFLLLKSGINVFWFRPAFSLSQDLRGSLKLLPQQVFEHMTGSYYYKQIIQLNKLNDLLGIIYTVLIFLAILLAFCFLLMKRPFSLLYVLTFSVMLTLASILLIPDYAPRYLLPLSAYAFLLFAQILKLSKKSYLDAAFFIPMISLGIYSLISFKDFRCETQTESDLKGLANWLVKKQIHYVFCRGPLLQWQLDFYSKEQIIARYTSATDRYPAYIRKVDSAFAAGEPTALVNLYNYLPLEQTASRHLVEGTYVVETQITLDTLQKYSFDINSKDFTK